MNKHRLGTVAKSLWLAMLLLAPLAMAEPAEDTAFQPVHEGTDFPVGWTEFNLNGAFSPQVRMIYPAMQHGEDQNMAGNGPFPWALLIGDSGEAIDGYMMLTEPLVQRGFIVVVSQPVQDETDIEGTLDLLDVVMTHMAYQNGSNAYVAGSASNIDVEHWALMGHGKGAAAAYLAFPYWSLADQSASHQPPRGLVGYGLDLEELSPAFSWQSIADDASFSTPNAALFMTGTVDEIAPSQATMERVEALGGLGWHWMHVLGADHYQFQDTRSIFENDGSPTMGQSEQIDLAVEHTVAYLDTVLKGEHARFRDAFNRADGPRTVSDAKAYIDEDLDASRFLVWSDITRSHNESVELNASHTFSLHANWTLRDGTTFVDLPSGWDVNVSCGWGSGSWAAQPSLDVNGTASCSYPMGPVAPGVQEAWMRVEVEGAPSMIWSSVTRGNTPVELVYPQPTLFVPQHGSSTLEIAQAAVDPDGQSVRVINATLVGADASHFSLTVANDQQSVSVAHALDEEWLGECMLQVQLRSDGGVLDEVNTSLRVMLTPVDDQVVKSGTVPIQEMDEDGAPQVFDFRTVVSDPEGEALLVRVDGQAVGEQGPIRFVIDEDSITFTPLPNAHGATVLRATVSDGSNPPIDLDIPVVVNAVNDPVVINTSLWEGDVVMDEDTVHVLNVAHLAYDVDDDPLVWSVEGAPASVEVMQDNNTFIFTPAKDYNGQTSGLWLNVSDGSSSHAFSFSLDVLPVGDLPFISITNVQRNAGSPTATVQWSILDVDGTASTNAEFFVSENLVASNHSCLENTPGSFQCVTLVPLPLEVNTSVSLKLKLTDEELDRSVIAESVLDLTTPPSSNTEVTTESDGASSTVMLIAGGLGLVVVLLLALVVRRRGGGSATEVPVAAASAEDERATGGGLLARANRLK